MKRWDIGKSIRMAIASKQLTQEGLANILEQRGLDIDKYDISCATRNVTKPTRGLHKFEVDVLMTIALIAQVPFSEFVSWGESEI